VKRAITLSFCLAMLLCSVDAQETLREGKKVLALVHWRVAGNQGHLVCEVSQVTDTTQGGSPSRELTVYREDGAKLTKIFGFETPDANLNVYPLGDYDARLFTTWVAGSAYHIRVFAFIEGQVKQVLEQDTKMPPELVYDDQGRELVFITTPVMENGKWTSTQGTTTAFRWNGRSYEKLGTVPWTKRLQCLSPESCVSSK
jgi:hypothetical protein